MRLPRTFLLPGVLLVLASIPELAGACVLTYNDSSVDTGQSRVNAWAFVEDYFDEGSCFYDYYYQWGYWEHTYEASVYISSPTQNWVFEQDLQSEFPYGGGSAYVFGFISYIDDPGDYDIDWWLWIFCTLGDWFINDYLTGQVNAGGAGPTCSGEPATMANEYQSGVVYTPGPTPALQCSQFRFIPPSTKVMPYFTWGELNGDFEDGNPHTGWGYLELSSLIKLQLTRIYYGMGIEVTSGYRCPHGNASLSPPGAVNSYHMQGRSFDMYKEGGTPSGTLWSQTEFDQLRAVAEARNPIESGDWDDYGDRHYHVTF